MTGQYVRSRTGLSDASRSSPSLSLAVGDCSTLDTAAIRRPVLREWVAPFAASPKGSLLGGPCVGPGGSDLGWASLPQSPGTTSTFSSHVGGVLAAGAEPQMRRPNTSLNVAGMAYLHALRDRFVVGQRPRQAMRVLGSAVHSEVSVTVSCGPGPQPALAGLIYFCPEPLFQGAHTPSGQYREPDAFSGLHVTSIPAMTA